MTNEKITYWRDDTATDGPQWIVDIDDGECSTTLSVHATKAEAETEAESQAASRGLQCVGLDSFGCATK
jgi:hypothetical protein